MSGVTESWDVEALSDDDGSLGTDRFSEAEGSVKSGDVPLFVMEDSVLSLCRGIRASKVSSTNGSTLDVATGTDLNLS